MGNFNHLKTQLLFSRRPYPGLKQLAGKLILLIVLLRLWSQRPQKQNSWCVAFSFYVGLSVILMC